MVLLLLAVFVLGAITVVALEAAVLWILIRRINGRVEREETEEKDAALSISSPSDLNSSLNEKQGNIWILEPEKVPKSVTEDKVPMDQRRRKDIFEITPTQKYARIMDHHLILTESDASSIKILLRNCTVSAVSATTLASRKWAKKYPIKVESNDSSVLYKGSNIIYIYLDTSWEKESWCKALRLASSFDDAWYSNLSMAFHKYLGSLSKGYPSMMKSSAPDFMIDRSVKLDNSSSKVRQFLKKLARKASKGAQDHKSVSAHDERKLSEKSRSFQESMVLENGLEKTGTDYTSASLSSVSTSTDQGSSTHISGISDSDYKNVDEGSLCFNLLISRLFFDARMNQTIRNSILLRIQRALSSLRVPSYVGELTCTSLDPGTLPPRILAMKMLPSDMNDMLACEIDVEYLGGLLLDIATRLEVRELELEGEDNNTEEVTSDLMEGFEYMGKQLKISMGEKKQREEGNNVTDEPENFKSTASSSSSQVPRWKSLLNSITKQVSQVPLSLSIKVSSLRGTLRLFIKPPPSDQIWFGFTSLPDIEFNLESFVGDHKVTSGHLALLLISRFKSGIRENMVLPNSESISISFMSAEKDDWVPRNVAPFMWYKSNPDSATNNNNSTKRESHHGVESTHTVEFSLPIKSQVSTIHEKTKSDVTPLASTLIESSLDELRVPLVIKDKELVQESVPRSNEDQHRGVNLSSRSIGFTEGQNEDDDTRPRRIGTRERMLGLGKKMGEKIEVKRRNIEEKGRSFVEKMRGPP